MTTANRERELIRRVDARRLEVLTLDLVQIRSYTGDTREVAGFYARHLESLGLMVEVIDEFPHSPDVVARLPGAGAGPTLELNGHLDTVPVEHSAPYVAGGRVYGRGAADMKGGVAAIAEAVRVLKESGISMRGNLMIVAHGLHEAPTGHGEDLSALVARGIKGDAAIIAELASDTLPIVGMGMAIFEIEVARPGLPTHELLTPSDTPHPILAANRLLNLIQDKQRQLSEVEIPYLGHESFFVGSFHSGDFYNRWPSACQIVGTRRYSPEKGFTQVEAELSAMARQVEAETGAQVTLRLTPTKDGFRVAEGEPLVAILRQAYREVAGKDLPLVGSRMVGDAPIFVNQGGIPALYHGPGGTGAHGDLESVAVADLVRAAQVYVLTALRYLDRGE